VNNADVKKAAAYAVGLQYPKVPLPRFTVKSAKLQVVAGRKYKLSIQIRLRTPIKSCYVSEFIVFRSLQDKYSLESKTVTANKC
jgi:hypothetical protein